MKAGKIVFLICIFVAFFLSANSAALAQCTCIAVGKKASADGSCMITHNDDSDTGDVRLWIIPAADWPKGATKEIVIDSHSYGDFGKYPHGNFPYKEAYGQGWVAGQMPQAPHTYRHFHCRYSFMNEKGLAMGETTCKIEGTKHAEEVKEAMMEVEGSIDIWFCMDIALKRCAKAKEAVRVIGELVEKYKWYGGTEPGNGECIVITDGDEVWIMEIYGRDLWCAVKLADEHVFVSANRFRIRNVDFKDKENVMHSPNLISYAVEKDWYDPKGEEPFRPADIYGPKRSALSSSSREWRALDLISPSLELKYDDSNSPYSLYPFSVKPDKKLTVDDVFKITGDNYEGTRFDRTKGPGSGAFGNPIPKRVNGAYGINRRTTLYGQISQVKGWLPDPIKGVVWFGYGAQDSTYPTPLNPNMKELPKFYSTGSRYKDFDINSGWWVNTRVTHLAEYCYSEAIKDIGAFREPKLEMLYHTVPKLQALAAELYKTDPNAAMNILHHFYYNNAAAMHEEWKRLGDMLLAKYNANNPRDAVPEYPDWWKKLISSEHDSNK